MGEVKASPPRCQSAFEMVFVALSLGGPTMIPARSLTLFDSEPESGRSTSNHELHSLPRCSQAG